MTSQKYNAFPVDVKLTAIALVVKKVARTRQINSKEELLKEAPKDIFSATSILFIPTKQNLESLGFVTTKSKKGYLKENENSPAFKAVEAFANMESVATQASRYRKKVALDTDWDYLIPSSQIDDFKKTTANMRSIYLKSQADFLNNYDELCSLWLSLLYEEHGEEIADLVSRYTPQKEALQNSFRFTADLKDFNIIDKDVNSINFVGTLFEGMISSVNKFFTLDKVINSYKNNNKKTTGKVVKDLYDLVEPKLTKYNFLDPKVKTLIDLLSAKLKPMFGTSKDVLTSDQEIEYRKVCNLLTSETALSALTYFAAATPSSQSNKLRNRAMSNFVRPSSQL